MPFYNSPYIFSNEDLRKFRDLIYKHTGNRLKDNNNEMIKSRISFRLKKLGLKSLSDYWAYYNEHYNTETDQIINALTTHHTAFFRERVHFDILAEWILQHIDYFKKRHQQEGQPIKVWSAACSKGHEAYSLAMFLEDLLKDHGVPIEITASDVDRLSVEIATNGVYPLEEVKTIPSAYLSQFWKKGTGNISGFAAVKNELKSYVKFKTVNLFNLDIDTFFAKSKFDVIFLRNVLIYFNNEDAIKIVDALKKRLNNVAALVTGLSEPIYNQVKEFKNTGPCFYAKEERPSSEEEKILSTVAVDKKLSSDKKKYSILCVDDSPTILTLLKKIFTNDKNCAAFYTAKNGIEATRILEEQAIDIMTLDIHMPVLDGIGFLERHYPSYRSVPVIIVSSVSRADRSLALRCLELGALDYVEKPKFSDLGKSSDEILSKVKTYLGKDTGNEKGLRKIDAVSDALSCGKLQHRPQETARIIIANDSRHEELNSLLSIYRTDPVKVPLFICSPTPAVCGDDSVPADTTARLQYLNQQIKVQGVYHIFYEELPQLFKMIRERKISIQFLTIDSHLESVLKHRELPDARDIQIVVSENAPSSVISRLKAIGITPDEQTPITSFPSLSNEFFSNLRCKHAS